jgi:lysophospholipase L1-like esterase
MKTVRIVCIIILVFSCNNEEMIINPFVYTQQYLVFLVRGDSISAGAGETAGPTTSTGIVYEWDQTNSVLIDRATTEFSNTVSGSPWKKFAIDMNAATGKRIVIIACGLSGAEVFPNGTGTNTHWAPHYDNSGAAVPGGTGSTLYTNSVTQVAACLTYLDKDSLDGILDIVGVNDARGAATLANISLGLTDFYDQTNIDFPGVPVYAASIGRDESNTLNDRKATIKRYQRALADARSYYNLTVNLLTFAPEAWALYQGDNLHPSQAGNNLIGEMYARYINYTETNKEVKQVWNSFRDTLSTAHKAAYKTWVETLQAGGDWSLLESFMPAIGSTRANVLCDVRHLGFAADVSFSFTANTFIRCTSTSAYRRLNVLPAYSWITAGQNDFIVGTKCKTNYTSAGTAAYLFGVLAPSSNRQIVLAQSVTNELAIIAGDNTNLLYSGHTSFQSNTLYSVYRNGTTKGLYVNGSSVSSAVQATISTMPLAIFEGVRNNNGTAQTPLDVEIEYSFQSAYTGFSISDFNTATETLLTALRIP